MELHGKDNFYYETAMLCGTQETANHWERYFIEKYDSIVNGYNITVGGVGATMLGRHHTSEAKARIAEGHRGRKRETPWLVGRVISQETRLLISRASTGKRYPGQKRSEETKRNISRASAKGWAESSEERKRKFSRKGTSWSLIDGKRVYTRPVENPNVQ